MNTNEITHAMAFTRIMEILNENIQIDNEWMLNYKLGQEGINNYPMSDEIKDKLSNNKQKYAELREQRRNYKEVMC